MLGPVEREVMAQLFASIPEEMGAVLVRSARSPNIRERRDCSAALFSADGELIAQAAHIPVHLGAMPEAVVAIAPKARAGDVWILNDPYTGGTHLPDVTIIEAVASTTLTPMRLSGSGTSHRAAAYEAPIAYAVVRAHHADVGGERPGSMPPGASSSGHALRVPQTASEGSNRSPHGKNRPSTPRAAFSHSSVLGRS